MKKSINQTFEWWQRGGRLTMAARRLRTRGVPSCKIVKSLLEVLKGRVISTLFRNTLSSSFQVIVKGQFKSLWAHMNEGPS